jgi:hypothetical protein
MKNKTSNPSEHAEQCAVVTWMQMRGIPHFAVPNGGTRNIIEATRLKASGVVRGAPDLCVFLPNVTVALEMKTRTGGALSAEQERWGRFFSERPGWMWYCARGAQDAIRFLEGLI